MDHEVRGQVTLGAAGRPAAGLAVAVMDADFLVPEPLARTTTGDDGGYRAVYGTGDYRKRFDREPDVYVVVYGDDGRVLADTRAAVARGAGPRQEVYVQLATEPEGTPPGALVTLADRTVERTALERLRRSEFLALARRTLLPGRGGESRRRERMAALVADLRPSPAADLVEPGYDLTAQIHFLEEVAHARGWEADLEEVWAAVRRDSSIEWASHSCPPFLITYIARGRFAVRPGDRDADILLPGTGTVVGRTSANDIPDYVERICVWLHFALSFFTGPPANLRPLPVGNQVEVLVLPTGGGVTGDGRILLKNDLNDDRLAWTVVHELAHLLQRRYQTAGLGEWHRRGEGCASLAEEFVMDAVNRYVAEAGDFAAEPGILYNPERSIIEQDHRQALFLKYMVEHLSRTAGVRQPDAEVASFRLLLETFDRWGYGTPALEQAVRAYSGYGSLFRFEYADAARLDEVASETLLGNFWIACYLKDLRNADADLRFSFVENLEPSLLPRIFEDPRVVAKLPPVRCARTVRLMPHETITLAFGPGATVPPFGAHFYRVDLDPGVDTVRVHFSASAGFTRALVQIVEVAATPGPTGSIRDILRSDRTEWIRTIASRPLAAASDPARLPLDHLLVVVGGTEDQAGDFTLRVQSVDPAPDVMVTRWNRRAGTHYEVDPLAHAWAWASPDVWVDNDRDGAADEGVIPGRDNRLCVRLWNQGNRDARDIQVEFWYQAAGGIPNDAAWRRVKDARGDDQVLTGEKLPAQSSAVFSVNWAPAPLAETQSYSLRVVVAVPGDPNTDNKRCFSNLATSASRDGIVEVSLLRRSFRDDEDVRIVVIPRAPGGLSATPAELRRANAHRVTVGRERVDRLRLRCRPGVTRRGRGAHLLASGVRDPLAYSPVHPDTLPPGFAGRDLVTVAHVVAGRVIGGFTWAVREGSAHADGR